MEDAAEDIHGDSLERNALDFLTAHRQHIDEILARMKGSIAELVPVEDINPATLPSQPKTPETMGVVNASSSEGMPLATE